MQSGTSQGGRAQEASLRPRTKRFITGLEEFSTAEATPSTSGNLYLDSPLNSRAPSPLPSKHPSRSSSARPITDGTHPHSSPSRRMDTNSSTLQGGDLAASLSGIFGKSWTSLQGLASSVLGSDGSLELVKDKPAQRQRRPMEYTHSSPQKAWGPSQSDAKLGLGSQEERQATLRARKREELLMSRNQNAADSRFKRRTSDDFDASSAPPSEYDDRDVLVYIYPLQRTDTLPGIAIKFNCPIDVVKKVNRLYSTSAMQIRRRLFIPVDSCAVRGRKVAAPSNDLSSIDGETSMEESRRLDKAEVGRDGASPRRPMSSSAKGETGLDPRAFSAQSAPSSPPQKAGHDDRNWKHDSWVELEGHPSKMEIGRVPRRELAFFPRARRKSLSYSDLDTPNASFDLPRPSLATSDTSSTVGAINTGTTRTAQHRTRRSSSANQWAQQMLGPGGVGLMSGRGASAPGPADDSFNKALRKHLPNLAPHVSSHEHDAGNGMSLEQMGGAIEGWVRKLAKSASHVGHAQASGSKRVRGDGDLIELSDAFEIGEADVDEADRSDDERGRVRHA